VAVIVYFKEGKKGRKRPRNEGSLEMQENNEVEI
jgi:hypothetical protein